MPERRAAAPARGLSAGPRRIDGSRPALFERLFEPEGPRVYHADALREAIAARLEALLATRAPASAVGKPAAARRVTEYGAGPEPGLSPSREEDRLRVAADIREAVAAFEPRLSSPVVEIAPDPDAPQTLRVRIAGAMRLGRLFEPFEFLAPLTPGRAP